MAAMDTAKHHPSHKALLVTIVMIIAMVILGFIAVFVPWVWKDLSVGVRAYAYPFKTCFEDTFSTANAESCLDNDFMSVGGAPVTQNNPTCVGFFLATIAFVFISVIGGVLDLLAFVYVLDQEWRRPICVATGAWIFLIILCIACFLSWIMFICYAEYTCQPNSIFPVRGYSYGFVCYIFATACSCVAVVSGFIAVKELKRFTPLKGGSDEDEPESPVGIPEYPEFSPIASPAAERDTPPVAPTPQQQNSFNNNASGHAYV